MPREEAKKKSEAKIKQITDLMAMLKIEPKAAQKLTQAGFIENVVLFMDREEYPEDPYQKDGPAPGHAPIIPHAPHVK